MGESSGHGVLSQSDAGHAALGLEVVNREGVALGRVAIVSTVEDGRAHLCFARPKGQPGAPMGEVLKQALQPLTGKGGGSADFATGSGDAARLDDALSIARAAAGGP